MDHLQGLPDITGNTLNSTAEPPKYSMLNPQLPKSDDSKMVKNVIKDLYKFSAMGTKHRANTMFYHIVRARNVRWMRQLLEELRQPGHAKLRAWVLGDKKHSNTAITNTCEFGRCKRKFSQHLATFALGFIMTLMYIILTPFFYVCHTVLSEIWLWLFGRTKNVPSLPLALVCRSKSLKMLQLFYDEGLDINSTDNSNNNVIHYLVTMSAKDAEGAITMWDNLCTVYQDANFSFLCTSANNGGLSPLELAARTGSLIFLCHMINSCRLNNKIHMQVNESQGFIQHSNPTYANYKYVDPSDHPKSVYTDQENIMGGYKLAWYNLTKYESGDALCNQSLLLRVLSQRDFTSEKAEELKPLLHNSALSSWIHKKTRSTGLILLRLFSNLYGLTLSALLVYTLSQVGGDTNLRPLGQVLWSGLIDAAEARAPFPLYSPNVTIHDVFAFCYSSEAYYKWYNVESWCMQESMQMVQKNCQNRVSDNDLFLNFGIIEENDIFSRFETTQNVMAAFFCSYLLFDFITRLVFLWGNLWGNSNNPSVVASFNRVVCHKLPGSYLSKQLTVLGITLNIGITVYEVVFYRPHIERSSQYDPTWTVEEFNATQGIQYTLIIGYVNTLCLLIRLLVSVYSLRLLPSIGHFIVVTFKMTQTLVQFLVVYLIILVAFGTMFHFLLRDPSCPIFRYEGYTHVIDASYEAFLLALGMTEFPPEHTDLAQAMYIIFLLLSALVLMNLIIAVMTSVVIEVSTKHQKPTYLLMQHLADALSAEAGWQVLNLSYLYWLHKWSLRKMGYIIEEGENQEPRPSSLKCGCCKRKYSVYIETVLRPH